MNKLHQAPALATIQLSCTRVFSIAIFSLFKRWFVNGYKAYVLMLAMGLNAFDLNISLTKSNINATSLLRPQFVPQFCMRQ